MSTNLKKLFASRHDAMKKDFDLSGFVASMENSVDTVGSPLAGGKELAGRVSMEAFGELGMEEANSCQELYASMEEALEREGFESFNAKRGADASRIGENQVMAATLAAIAGNEEVRYKRSMRGMTSTAQSNNPNVINISPMMDGPHGSMPVLSDGQGLENYNEKSQRDFRVISVAYNLAAARQDAFGEAIYPTVVVNPTEGGVTQNLTYAAVLKDVFHEITGALFDTREVNMVEAFRDPTVLEDASTKLVPVVDDADKNARVFVDPAVIAPVSIDLEKGGTVNTAPLKIGEKFDLIGVSNRQQLIAGNMLDVSDTIDPAMRLKNLYVRTGGATPKVIKFTVERMPTAVFQPSLTNDTRLAQLNFTTEDLVISGSTKAIDGSTNAAIDEMSTRNWTMRVSVSASGNVSLSKGDAWIHATPVVIDKLFDDEGTALDKTAGDAATVVAAFGQLEVVGYDLDARFTNTNRRERGQLVQTRTLQFRYPIPMHSPITLPMSTMDESGPGDVVKTLTVATNIRNSNNAVTRLLNYLAQLREVVTSGYDRPKFGAVEGALSAMIRPTYRSGTLDLEAAIDTVRSKDRWEDVCQTILNTIKSLLFPAYRDSNIEAAFQTVTGNADERPKFIIACDKELANYLMRTGDDRTLGSYLKYDIVSTNNERFDGKIVVIPTRENPVENDILNFGQFYYVPTIVADLPISRNGQTSREIAAVPFNLHVNNIPFALEIDVVGLDKVMGSSQYNSLPGFQTEQVTITQEPEPTP